MPPPKPRMRSQLNPLRPFPIRSRIGSRWGVWATRRRA
ncbi:putative protein without homology [Propionibacterium freudenreichii subsp. shermanii]|nr:putative protein without homology [Propionibacterium freudenreichii subsp. shermanii]